MKITTKQITTTAALLAICIIFQYFKPTSTYITGPIVNATLILATIGAGLVSGALISIIAPITAFFFTGSPIMAAIPLMFPVIMLGNLLLVLFTYFFYNKVKFPLHFELGLLLGSIVKALFLGLLVVYVIIPTFGSDVASHLPKVLDTAKIMFSTTQLITATTGSIIAYLVWIPLKKALKSEQL